FAPFQFSRSAAAPDLHSFPTRRSSDLEAVGWMSSAIRLGLAGGTALAGPLGGHFAVPLMAAALCALLLSARTATAPRPPRLRCRSEEHTSELQSRENLVCRLLLEKKKV